MGTNEMFVWDSEEAIQRAACRQVTSAAVILQTKASCAMINDAVSKPSTRCHLQHQCRSPISPTFIFSQRQKEQFVKAHEFQLLSFKMVVPFPHLNMQTDSLSYAFHKSPEGKFTWLR